MAYVMVGRDCGGSVPAKAAASWRAALVQIAILLVTLALLETALRILNPGYLRIDDWSGLDYRHDAELGWTPIPNATTTVALPRTLALKNNSLGLRDIEFERGAKPTMLVLGDSNVWGYNVEDGERFTNLLRPLLPGHTIVNAGVSGYGTDQEYLLLRRLCARRSSRRSSC